MRILSKLFNKGGAVTNAASFIKNDYWSALYPLKTNLVVVENYEAGLSEYIYQRVLGPGDEDNFIPQQRVYATKPRGHLRRTVKLDPVAEYFIYDVVFRNRSIFRRHVSDKRLSFGYRFEKGGPVSINAAYRDFRKALTEKRAEYKHVLRFDIASYFNSIYHHDLAHWFESKDSVSAKDSEYAGRFFREIGAGRSVDFLPQGIYPAKMIGNEFLKFIELSAQVRCAQTVRFMDDFYLFDDSESVLFQDFIKIQQLLGGFSLNVNPSKTGLDNMGADVSGAVSEIKKSLMEVVEIEEYLDTPSGVEVVSGLVEVERNLSGDQVETLLTFLKDDSLEESDADLILSILRAHSDSVVAYLPSLLSKFPNIYKHIYAISGQIGDKEALARIILDFLGGERNLLEYQLFWLGVIVEENLEGTAIFGDVLSRLFELTADHKVARAKILEIPVQKFGFKEIRAEYLKTGSSDWLSWASAVGSRTLKPAERNYVLDYFSKCSRLNYIIASAVKNVAV
ncbi:antiviral reverse transcriptase Drt5 [Lysobacter enzymogenes]|uniref:antiviral reverse transcriptase Drt5 n=1 Tax=Lysobacter enzymogenes TaxID=69 RepID=UPI001AF87347|nr:antiviral reverse transcriptase Drt5 [Lysobacter enzymogenes]QQP99475.1 hypothetical protein JHW41_15250 [Lysobacter enzymogenes]